MEHRTTEHKHALRRGPAALTDTPWIVVIMRAASSLAHERIYDQSAPACVPFGSRYVRLIICSIRARGDSLLLHGRRAVGRGARARRVLALPLAGLLGLILNQPNE